MRANPAQATAATRAMLDRLRTSFAEDCDRLLALPVVRDENVSCLPSHYAGFFTLLRSLLLCSPPGTKDELLTPTTFKFLFPCAKMLLWYGMKHRTEGVEALHAFVEILTGKWGTDQQLQWALDDGSGMRTCNRPDCNETPYTTQMFFCSR
ncbi:hypothetical protein CALCODRAFT_125571 [Calocera cornea HHB12733]|uniref:Uncharacterized protein n=1 Tax=Calocera cornea HHB12733 TaxID=1353952 RepID=A0A165CWU3_9BASI|nr:hypothetical protein CALCODRAFT_125571 [Calocera cornea HHB12733]